MGMAVPEAPVSGAVDLPGLSKYRELGFPEIARGYQKVAADFLVRRSGAMLCDPMRAGKCIEAIMADTLVGSRRTLFVAPALAKWVWSDELLKWTGEGAFILDGLSGRQARQVCVTCRGRGDVAGETCSGCVQHNGQSYGYIIHEARTISRPIPFTRRVPPPPLPTKQRRRSSRQPRVRHVVNLFSDAARRTGEWYGPPHPTRTRIAALTAEYEREAQRMADSRFRCTKHEDVTGPDPSQTCFKCWTEFRETLKSARYVVTNYDILGAQRMDVGGGVMQERYDLQGWASTLEWLSFDVVILDESHVTRGRAKNKKDRLRSRQAKLRQILQRVSRVWLLSGTPIYAYVRDLQQQLDLATKGLFGDEWAFDERYCEGHRGEFGWVNTGRSILADTELKPRLKTLMLKRSRADIYDELPPKTRQVIRIDPEGTVGRIRRDGDRIFSLEKALAEALSFKVGAVIENVVQGLVQGEKCIVYSFSRKNARTLFRAIESAIVTGPNASALRRASARCWLGSGEVTAKARAKMCKKFEAHTGAGAFVATTDAFRDGGVSMKSASAVHFADLHWLPTAMFQAEDRAWDRDNGFSILYYIANGTVDERFEDVVLPRVEMLSKMADEKSAEEMQSVLTSSKDDRSVAEEMFARLTKHLRVTN